MIVSTPSAPIENGLSAKSPALKAGFRQFDATQAGVYGTRAWRKRAAAKRYPEVAFAPVPERYVVRRVKEDFDNLPLNAPFPSVTLPATGDSGVAAGIAQRLHQHAQ